MDTALGHTSFQLDRRAFLKAGVTGAGALALGPAFLRRAFAAGPVTVPPAGPYGPLGPFDANGIALPPGFTSREIARGGQLVRGSASSAPYTWHFATDGQATFPTLADGAPDGGWILVANSEVPGAGGASAVEFSPDGEIERAYRILAGTSTNCAGGPTPWGTWLSCEEYDQGRVWECDPAGSPADAVARPAMGQFSHEAVCVDRDEQRLYLTEDEGDAAWYRFTPAAYPDLSAGVLEVAKVDGAGHVTWVEVPDPAGGAANPTRNQVDGVARFDGAEGTWYDDGKVYFTTKGDGRVWLYDVATSRLEVLYDPETIGPDAPLSGVDNITVSQSGDLFVCEDGRDHDICMITPDFTVSRFLTLDPEMHAGTAEANPLKGNETVGVVFNPDGTRMYFGAQRSFADFGVTPRGAVYEVTGPFRTGPVTTAPPPGGGPSPDRDLLAPRLKLAVRSRLTRARFARRGLSLGIDLDEPAGVRARLEVRSKGRYVPIARAAPSVALNGRVVLRLRAGERARRRLRGRTAARLTVIAVDAAGNRRVARRTVLIGQ